MQIERLASYLCPAMAHEIIIPPVAEKEQLYQALLPQLEALLADESNFIANVANAMAMLKSVFQWWWVGSYWVSNDPVRELVLGPFQGPVACTRIGWGKGVCGHAWQSNQSIIVPNVALFDGHIACSAVSQSEIVVPVRGTNGEVIGVIDADSEFLNHFDSVDQLYLERIAELLGGKYGN